MTLSPHTNYNNSPVFYTGCVNSNVVPTLNEICNKNSVVQLTPNDFKNMQNSLNLIYADKDPFINSTTSCRTLLPLPSSSHINSWAETSEKESYMVFHTSTPIMADHTNINRKIKKAKRILSDNKGDNETKSNEQDLLFNFSSNEETNVENDEVVIIGSTLAPSVTAVKEEQERSIYDTPGSSGNYRKRKGILPNLEDTKKIKFQRNLSSSDDVWDQLSGDIWRLYCSNKQTDEVFDKKEKLRCELHSVLQSVFPTCRLYIVGSSMTGFGHKRSDMDMCLMVTEGEIDQKTEARNYLLAARSRLLKCPFIKHVQFIPAKVPILRFKDSVSYIEVDLNFNQTTGIRNTQLLNSYARIDKRVAPLVLLVKMWAKQSCINDAKYNTLSSYSLALMVIHFLQYACTPSVVPCLQRLQPDKYHSNSNIRNMEFYEVLPNFHSQNTDSLGKLFYNFLHYFAYQFDFMNDVMSVRVGGVLPKEMSMNFESPKNKLAHWKYIGIEEPFDLTNTACSVCKDTAFDHILDAFKTSCNFLSQNRNLKDLINSVRF